MKVSDYIAQFLASKGIKYVFGLQGGAVVHLFDSIDKTPGIEAVYCHHEQCAALAAVSYSRVSENTGAVIVTTGPGSTNAMTGLLAAWQDSIPCFFISGQTRKEHTSYGRKVRQVGTQELNIVDIVRPLTKYAKFIDTLDSLEAELERAYQISQAGRPGPVWLDIPVNLQWENFQPRNLAPVNGEFQTKKRGDFQDVAKLLRAASRPIVIAGHGIRSGKAAEKFRNFVADEGIPFVTTWTACDLLPTGHPLNTGIIGISGQRGANKAVHSADLLLVLGSHLSIPQTSTLFDQFAVTAKKIVVNIDEDQLDNLNIKVDLPVVADVNEFFSWINANPLGLKMGSDWTTSCEIFRGMNTVQSGLAKVPAAKSDVLNSYVFNDLMTKVLPKGACIVIDGGGTALYTGFQSTHVGESQRVICSSTMSSMGTGLAESIGACFANGRQLTTCLIGDGSFLMNVQDLQVIFHHKLPIKIFVVNNNGYLAIRHTQASFLDGRYCGTSKEGGLSFPEVQKISDTFEIPYFYVSHEKDVERTVRDMLLVKGPAICEVMVPDDQEMLFKQGYIRNGNGTFSPMALGEMWPFTDS
jgi:acetolactate synthase-1/2/3 large subunit